METKAEKRQRKALQHLTRRSNATVTGPVDAACVIHGSLYDWTYVERLYSMLSRHLSMGLRFHVYTEHDRSVPPHMIKHCLEDWPGVKGHRRGWWYKMQLFNPEHHQGNLLYLDLDTIIVNNIDWAVCSDTKYFWTIKDFVRLQYPTNKMNSSMMWWNVSEFAWVWHQFNAQDKNTITRRYHGDQDYLHVTVAQQIRHWEDRQFQSWRWQCWDGGYDFSHRKHRKPGAGAQLDPDASVIVFHGSPKPHQITDPVIQQLWR